MSLAFLPTPNPNALKCVPTSPLPAMLAGPHTGLRSYSAAPETDALARELFAIEGVCNVLITPQWFTVSKLASSDWPPIQAALTALVIKLTKLQTEQAQAGASGG